MRSVIHLRTLGLAALSPWEGCREDERGDRGQDERLQLPQMWKTVHHFYFTL